MARTSIEWSNSFIVVLESLLQQHRDGFPRDGWVSVFFNDLHLWTPAKQVAMSKCPVCWRLLQHFHSQDWSISNFPCSLNWNITSHSMENLAFHWAYSDLRWLYYQFPLPYLYISLGEGWRLHFLDLGVKVLNASARRMRDASRGKNCSQKQNGGDGMAQLRQLVAEALPTFVYECPLGLF